MKQYSSTFWLRHRLFWSICHHC